MADPKNEDEKERSEQQVPATYAEKAMSSLLRLHDELVEEKEKRIDLYRRLMDREQQLAELRSYVHLLEGELSRQGALPPAAPGLEGEKAPIAGRRAIGLEGPRPHGPLLEPPEAAPKGAAPGPAAAPPTAAPTTSSGPSQSGPAPIVAWIPANAKRGGSR